MILPALVLSIPFAFAQETSGDKPQDAPPVEPGSEVPS
jgi:hypothetical protein